MDNSFKNLDADAYRKLKDSIALITILVAGADGKIDFAEKNWGQKMTEIRTYDSDKLLRPFYKEVGVDYSDRFQHYIDILPGGLDARNKELATLLGELNDILPQLGAENAVEIYKEFKSFAKHVAKISGGFLGFLSVSRAEEDMMSLPMIKEFK